MSGIFKAYDVRGIYPDELNETLAEKIGLAFRYVLTPEDLQNGQNVVVSRDMRSHSKSLCDALISGLRAGGLEVVDLGLATTPMNYFAVGKLKAAGGVQVTASHNPAQYNGCKFSRSDAQPVSGDHGIPLIQERVTSGNLDPAAVEGTLRPHSIFPDYALHVLSYLKRPESAEPLKVVVDAANGMSCLYRPILDELGIELVPLYFKLDGTFPNHEANPLKPENLIDLCNKIKETGADLGVSFDGDADRAAFVDEMGEPVGSDLSTALIAGELLAREPGQHVLYDLRSSRAVPEYIKERGGIPVRERVGHSFMKATLREKQGLFGGELAGHYYFRDAYHADSAILAVVEVLNALWRTEQTLSELVAPLRRYAKSPEINFMVEDKQAKMVELARHFADGKIDYLDGITVEYEDWWFNVRPSNTEPYLRLVLEAESRAALEANRTRLQELLGQPV